MGAEFSYGDFVSLYTPIVLRAALYNISFEKSMLNMEFGLPLQVIASRESVLADRPWPLRHTAIVIENKS